MAHSAHAVFLDISQTGARLLVAGRPVSGPAFLSPSGQVTPEWVEFDILVALPSRVRPDQYEVRGKFPSSCSYGLFQSALAGLDLSSSRNAITSLTDPSENDSLVWR
jgi:hypothetical protein